MNAGFVLWFTGLSGSGKSTLAAMVGAELRRRGVRVETLDGDEIRKNLSRGLGFSREDRDENVRRLGFVAGLLARGGACAITAAISPYRDARHEVRRGVERFCEVFCECPVTVLAERDPKGLYKRALRGEIKNFTGVDDPYESPPAPEVHLRTDGESAEASAARVLQRLEELGFVPAAGRSGSATPPAAPHGQQLSERWLGAESSQLERARDLPRMLLTADEEAALVGFATGAFSPLTGFLGRKDFLRTSRERRLERGLFWPTPIVLRDKASHPFAGDEVALVTEQGRVLARMAVTERWSEPSCGACLAGDVDVFELPSWADGVAFARQTRSALGERAMPAGIVLDNRLPTKAVEYTVRAWLEFNAGLLLLPGVAPGSTPSAPSRTRAFERLASSHFRAGTVLSVPCPSLDCSWQERFLLAAIMAQNHGASRLLVPQAYESVLQAVPAASELGVECIIYDDAEFQVELSAFAGTRTLATGPAKSPAERDPAPQLRSDVAMLLEEAT